MHNGIGNKRNNAFVDIFGRPAAPAPQTGVPHPQQHRSNASSYPQHRNSPPLPPTGPSALNPPHPSHQQHYQAGQRQGQRVVSGGSYSGQQTHGGGQGSGGGGAGGGARRSSYYPVESGHPSAEQQQAYHDGYGGQNGGRQQPQPQRYHSPEPYQGAWQGSDPSSSYFPDGTEPSSQQDTRQFSSPRSSYASTMASGPSTASTSSLYSHSSTSPATSLQYAYSNQSGPHGSTSPSNLSPSLPTTALPNASSAPPRLPDFSPGDPFYGFESSRGLDRRDSSDWSSIPVIPERSPHSSYVATLPVESDGFDQFGASAAYQRYDPHSYNQGASSYGHSRRGSTDSYRTSGDQRPLLPLNPSLMSVSTLNRSTSSTPSNYQRSLQPRKSSESVRVLPTQAKVPPQDRAMSFSSSSQRPDLRSDPSMSGTSSIGEASVASSSLVPLRAPVVYPALLSRVAEAFKARVIVNERLKDGLVYPDTFDGRDAVDKIAYIIKTTDRNLALLLGRALDAQKFFHDVTYDHRLRDSALELYQFKERLTAPFLSSDDLSPADDPDAAVSIDESTIPSGVFTLLTDCYSPTCTRDRLCYSIACPRRLEQQARLNLKPKPGLQRSVSSESLGDLREPGSLWIHSVPQDIADSTSDSEKKRQEALNEVFYTERDFVRDMEYLRDCWIKPLRSSNIIPEDRREDFITQVFWNVLEIHAVNVRLAEMLNKRQKQAHVVDKVGDIFLEVVPHFAPFVKYGAHQLYGKYEFEKEKGSNPAFAKFVEETERLPESRKLELNGYLTKPTTRLARYPLLLEACLKNTPEDSSDKVTLPKVVKLVREFLTKVNIETGRSENRFNLAQLDQQLVFKNGEAVDLRLRDEEREIIYKGPLKKRGGTQSESAELQVFLFDHAILMVKQKGKNEQYKVYRKPIPLELLVIAPIDDSSSGRAGAVRPKSLMSRGSNARYLANPPPGIDKNSKQGFAMTFVHLGRRGYQITLWSASWAGRKKWVEKIEGRQQELRERSLVFETLPLSSGFFVGTNRVTCAAPFDNGNRMVYGTDNGVYLSNLRDKAKVPVKVISVSNVTQLDVLEEQGILIVLADKAVQTFFVDNLDPGDAVGAAKRARKISSHATFFKAGQCLGRTLVCIVKSGSVSSTIKTLEPIDQVRGKKQPALRKFLQGTDSLRVFKEFYIPTESSSVHFLKSKLCVGTTKGFEIVDLETLDTQGLLDPADSSLDFIQKRETARPIAIYRIDGDFLLCYDEFAFYVNKNGWRAKSNWIIQWEGFPTSFALHYPFVLAFEPTFCEVRHVESGALMQIIPGNNLRCLFADTPPSASSAMSSAYFPSGQQGYGYAGSLSSQSISRYPSSVGRSEIILSDYDRVFSLQFTAP